MPCSVSPPQNKDGSYTGFIKVQFKLVRPVSVPPPKKGITGHEGGKKTGGVKRRTSFYLPKDTSKHLHISSRTSAREVIEALLKKFTVVDNPGKFALFERSERHDQGKPPIELLVFFSQSCHGQIFVRHFTFCDLEFVYSALNESGCLRHPQFTCVSCLMMCVRSTCVCVLVPMRRSSVWC